ncbi:kinase-like domain-containing protein [Infundibulicybe gibba]|nr:kinase-like domain-containing protein [Infundibulicybe gibba]
MYLSAITSLRLYSRSRLNSRRPHHVAKEPFVSRFQNFSSPSPTDSSPSTPSINLPRHHRQSWSAKSPSVHSLQSATIEDVLAPGDVVHQHGLFLGEPIRLVSAADSHLAVEFEVVRRLGTGSYAVVYLVQELDGQLLSRPDTVYGSKYAIKCLSKANLDDEALAAQMSEVGNDHQSLHSHPNIVTLHRTLETDSYLLLILEPIGPPDSTPPTPSLLSNMHPSQLLSRTRLRLVSSMFSQMCDAVASCHDQRVFHRDIKPENFIVTDGWLTAPDGRQERKVIVKLSDFGLSTTDLDSSDMDCGSAPYMSYECRNNVAPTYRPRAADVWSLGIVLINMLYHFNPWTDTAQGTCSSFDIYRRDPINFFMYRFTGMTRPVAEFLAMRVFCLLEDPEDDSQRITAADFGAWAKHLPGLLGTQPGSAIHRSVSSSSAGHPISASTPVSHRPTSRHPSVSASVVRTPALPSRSLSRAPSLIPAYEREEPSELSVVYDQEELEEESAAVIQSRSTSTNKRRKRGTRKGRGAAGQDETLSLAREISKASRASSSQRSVSASNRPAEPVSMYPLPIAILTNRDSSSRAPAPATATIVPPPVTKKPSKWKLSFGKASAASLASPADEGPTVPPYTRPTANVTNLIMSLGPPPPAPLPSGPKMDDTWGRGRRTYASPPASNASTASLGRMLSTSPNSTAEHWGQGDRRAVSPNSTRSGRPLASSASSVVSGNWRSSMSTTSSAGTSTSAFTRYSNSSARSISTVATSVSATSWRTNGKPSSPPTHHSAHPNLPKNIKLMNGVPWELDQLPRGQHPNPVGDIFGSPPVRKQRTRKPKDPKLGTITERPPPRVPEFQRRDASTSTTDLGGRDDEVRDCCSAANAMFCSIVGRRAGSCGVGVAVLEVAGLVAAVESAEAAMVESGGASRVEGWRSTPAGEDGREEAPLSISASLSEEMLSEGDSTPVIAKRPVLLVRTRLM